MEVKRDRGFGFAKAEKFPSSPVRCCCSLISGISMYIASSFKVYDLSNFISIDDNLQAFWMHESF